MLELPYYADSSTLPAPLPTMQDIANAKEAKEFLNRDTAISVFHVNEHFIVKCGNDPRLLWEAENLLFIANNTNLHVPRVYAVFTDDSINPCRPPRHIADEDLDVSDLFGPLSPMMEEWIKQARQKGPRPVPKQIHAAYVIMEYIPGQTLREAWPSLSEEDKGTVIDSLKRQMDEVRSIPSPGWFGRHDQRPFEQLMMLPVGSDGKNFGPFKTEAEFTAAVLVTLQRATRGRNRQVRLPHGVFQQGLPEVFNGHPSVFTHGDLQRENIIISRLPPQHDGKAAFEVVIVDWLTAAWLPSWFEYAVTLFWGSPYWGSPDDWMVAISKWLKPYYKEYGWFNLVVHEVMI